MRIQAIKVVQEPSPTTRQFCAVEGQLLLFLGVSPILKPSHLPSFPALLVRSAVPGAGSFLCPLEVNA